MKVGEKIKYHRTGMGWSQSELAQRVGVGRVTIVSWEKGNIANVSIQRIERLADVFGVTIAYLLDDSKNPSAGMPSKLGKDAAEDPKVRSLLAMAEEMNDVGRAKMMAYANDLLATNRYNKGVSKHG